MLNLLPQISSIGRYSISNITQQLTICQQMLKIGEFIVYYFSFNLADLNWPEEQSISIRYLC